MNPPCWPLGTFALGTETAGGPVARAAVAPRAARKFPTKFRVEAKDRPRVVATPPAALRSR